MTRRYALAFCGFLLTSCVPAPKTLSTPAPPTQTKSAAPCADARKYNEGDVPPIVKRIIVEKLGVDESEVADTATLVDGLGADSFDVILVAVALERQFCIEIPEDDYLGTLPHGTVADAVRLVKRLLAAANRLTP